jgi:hypothetical protein
MKIFFRIAMIVSFLKINCFVFAQTSIKKDYGYIIAFNPVYSSGLIDMGQLFHEDLYLIVSDAPLSIDSVMSVLSQKNYSSFLSILDTLNNDFKIYKVIENSSKSEIDNEINISLLECSNYRKSFLFNFNDTIKKSSSLIGFIIRLNTSSKKKISYKISNKDCDYLPGECAAQIISL